jgi:pentatricopeptide repeat protein
MWACIEGNWNYFHKMQQELWLDFMAFVGVLIACTNEIALEEGKCVHQQIVQSGLEMDVFLWSNLVNMYAKCGSIEDAWRVFNKMPS